MKKIISLPPQYFFVSIFLIVIFRLIELNLNLIYFPLNLSGILFIICGLIFIIFSYQLFMKHQTPENFSLSTCVVKEGLYKYSRNPMYLGAVIFLLGLTILFQNIIAFLSPLFFFLIMNFIFIPYEERKMEREIGGNYLAYKSKTRRWI